MSDPTRLLLMRHGESRWNQQRRWQGHADAPLSPIGEAQAQGAAVLLADAGLTRVVSSDLQRAHRTAAIIARALGLGPVERRTDLREIDVGEWSGLTVDAIERRWPGMLGSWREGTLQRPPGGEDRESVTGRVVRALCAIAERHPGERVLVVTHGGCIRSVESHLGLEARPVANASGRWFTATGSALAAGEPVLAG
jgi:probable phosphoglycerate mutase